MLHDLSLDVPGTPNQLTLVAARSAKVRAAGFRADARAALEGLAETAQSVLRLQPVELREVSAAIAQAALKLDLYCAYVRRFLVPTVAMRGPFGALLASHLKQFEQRQQNDIQELKDHLARAPRSAGVAHGVSVVAILLMADLDAHGRDVALVLRG
jgi:hypothetical protein